MIGNGRKNVKIIATPMMRPGNANESSLANCRNLAIIPLRHTTKYPIITVMTPRINTVAKEIEKLNRKALRIAFISMSAL